MFTDPFDNPQLAFADTDVTVIADGSVIVTVVVAEQLFKSLTVTV